MNEPPDCAELCGLLQRAVPNGTAHYVEVRPSPAGSITSHAWNAQGRYIVRQRVWVTVTLYAPTEALARNGLADYLRDEITNLTPSS